MANISALRLVVGEHKAFSVLVYKDKLLLSFLPLLDLIELVSVSSPFVTFLPVISRFPVCFFSAKEPLLWF